MKLSHASMLITSRDRVTQKVAQRMIEREEHQKRIQFKPATISRQIMADDPGARRQVLAKRAKSTVSSEDAAMRRENAEALPLQGQMLRTSGLTADNIWAIAVSKLGSEAMKFALNCATDTLPHNSNLHRWYGKTVSDQCKLCGKKQTLLHVLNNCQVALRLRRYNRRHDCVLELITKLAQSYLPHSYELMADLHVKEDQYHFPSHISPTSLRPDLVLWSDTLYA